MDRFDCAGASACIHYVDASGTEIAAEQAIKAFGKAGAARSAAPASKP